MLRRAMTESDLHVKMTLVVAIWEKWWAGQRRRGREIKACSSKVKALNSQKIRG